MDRVTRWFVVLALLIAGISPRPVAAQSPGSRPLRLTPDKGVAGSTFTVRADSLTPGSDVAFDWRTWDGGYATTVSPETVQYEQRTYTPRRVTMAHVTAGADGVAEVSLLVPEDYGEVHDVFANVDGLDVARAGFRVQLSASISPTSGPIGAPVTLTVRGMAAELYSGSTLAVRYDNAYMGLLTATTTSGTASASVRAAGPVGPHTFILNAGTVPAYLNIQQSPYDFFYAHLPNKEDVLLPFTVTADEGAPADALEWPQPAYTLGLAPGAPRTTSSGAGQVGISASLEPAAGPISTATTLKVSGLMPGAPLQAYWVTARGNRVTPSGWSLEDIPLLAETPGQDGVVSAQVQIPDDLGGWHVLKLVQNNVVVGETPFYVDRSLASVSAHVLRAGESVTIDVKGIGWTELDNGFAMTYDNQFAGYACGFNSNGDVTLQVLATGGPGTHLIDLYPMLYAGKDKKAWYWAPVLTFAQDFPALSIGYRVPTFRLAISVQ